MHFHLPKPLHGWREFAGEVGIIVVGVLIALGAEQLVTQWHWRNESNQAVAALHQEMNDQYYLATEMVVDEPCIDAQLQNLEERVLAPGPYRPVAVLTSNDLRFAYRAPVRVWPDNIWKSVVAEGDASHFQPQLRQWFGSQYANLDSIRDEAQHAHQLMWQLRVLTMPIEPDAATKARLVEEIEEARGYHSLLSLASKQLMGDADRQLREGTDQRDFRPTRAELIAWLRASATVEYCRANHLPLGEVTRPT